MITIDHIQQTKPALASAAATATAGIATWMDLVADIQGMIATGFGIILTGMIIFIKAMDIKDRFSCKSRAKHRKAEGLPCDRKEDKDG